MRAMRTMTATTTGTMLGVLLVLGVLTTPPLAWGARDIPCPNVIDLGPEGTTCPGDIATSMAQCCPCDHPQFRNHGQYVRCVAHAANALRRAGCLEDRDLRRSLKRCAARSTCNKPEGFVTCCIEIPVECEDGLCAGTDIGCLTSDECAPRTRCTLKRGEDHCLDRGGVPGTGSCCSACSG